VILLKCPVRLPNFSKASQDRSNGSAPIKSCLKPSRRHSTSSAPGPSSRTSQPCPVVEALPWAPTSKSNLAYSPISDADGSLSPVFKRLAPCCKRCQYAWEQGLDPTEPCHWSENAKRLHDLAMTECLKMVLTDEQRQYKPALASAKVDEASALPDALQMQRASLDGEGRRTPPSTPPLRFATLRRASKSSPSMASSNDYSKMLPVFV
jgi:hypothetical protein